MLTKIIINEPNWAGGLRSLYLLAIAVLVGYSNNSTFASPVETENSLETAIVSDFADYVVIPTYTGLVDQAETLNQTVTTFTTNPTDENLEIVQQAWSKTRSFWEQSEAFAFGPAESLGYDGDLDDWPVNETDIIAILEDTSPLNEQTVENLQTTQKGFHTIELLLFGEDNNKIAANFTERELELLNLLTSAFNQTAKNLTQSWTQGIAKNPGYKEVLASAGDKNNQAYPTVKAAMEEIVQGIIGCLDEVANEKIGQPLETKEIIGFESRFSQTSAQDFGNNIQSVANAYLGQFSNSSTDSNSLSDLVAANNPALDAQVKQEIEDAIAAVQKIPTPIETKLTETDAIAQLEIAQKTILTLLTTIQEQVLPITQ